MPESIRPFVRHDPRTGATEFMIPQLKPAIDRRIVIEASADLIHWQALEAVEWGSLESVSIRKRVENGFFLNISFSTQGI